MKRRTDLVGQVVGPFKIISLDEKLTVKNKRSHFICICDKCLKECVINSSEIKRAKSCGCERGVNDNNREAFQSNKTHFFERRLLNYARRNSKRRGEECNLELKDIVIPEYCPLLGIKLNTEKATVGSGLRVSGPGSQDSCPSVDRIDSSKGYTRENVWIISKRANVIKNNASIEELRMIYEGLLRRG
jgi:hypothetical protein